MGTCTNYRLFGAIGKQNMYNILYLRTASQVCNHKRP